MAAARGQLSWASLPLYSLAQLVGGCLGTALANLMFEQPAWEWSTKLRDGSGIWLSEVIATAGLLLVIALTTATRSSELPQVPTLAEAEYQLGERAVVRRPGRIEIALCDEALGGELVAMGSAGAVLGITWNQVMAWYVTHGSASACRPAANSSLSSA